MKIKKWLTITQNGAARLTSGKPSIRWDEISILLECNIPDEIFRRPRLEAKIDLPKEAVGPDVLSSEVVENVKEAIEQNTGLTFSVNVIKEDTDENHS
jgi:hypothetical protein